MAFYAEEEEVWKCPKHPSKRRRTGICPTCLKDRLGNLCPDCAAARPCACSPSAATATSSSSSSSSSSSFSVFSRFGSRRETSVGSVGRVSNLIDGEPSFRRSSSVAIPFIRSRFPPEAENRRKSSSSFWSAFKAHRGTKKCEGESKDGELNSNVEAEEEKDNYLRRMMRRSRSVASGIGDFRRSSASRKGKIGGWHLPSPMSVFRHSKSKVVHERSPLYRG